MYSYKAHKASTLVRGLVFLSISVLVGSVLLLDILRVKPTQASMVELPSPVELLKISGEVSYPVLKAIKLDKDNPTKIEFLIDSYDKDSVEAEEAARIVNYFLAGLTTKESDLWVNLSPYESDRIMYDGLEKTDFGKELLTQDYILKQFVSSLTFPETELGQKYWNQLSNVDSRFSVESNTFNKVWIVPSSAQVRENGTMAYVKEAKLDVQYEKDYLAHLENDIKDNGQNSNSSDELLDFVRDEVSHGENFARLRQLYHSLVLATWFKKKFQNSFYKHYINNDQTKGIDHYSSQIKDQVYSNYVESFNKGVYDLTKKEQDPQSGKKVRRRYFSGGVVCSASAVFAVSFEENLKPNMKGQSFKLQGRVLPEYTETKNSSAVVKESTVSSSVKRPQLDFEKTKAILEHKDKLKSTWELMGDQERVKEIEKEEKENTRIQRENFNKGMDYFNQDMLVYDDQGNKLPASWEQFMMLYAIFRGDIDGHSIIAGKSVHEIDFDFEEVHSRRIENIKKNDKHLLDVINAVYESKEDLLDAISGLYVFMIEEQPFGDLDGFTEIVEKGAGFAAPDSGHNRSAWYMANFMLWRNGYEFFYFKSPQDQERLNGKAAGRSDIRVFNRKANIVIELMGDLQKVTSSSVGGIDLNDIDIEVEASSALLADVDIDFDSFVGFSYKKESIDKLDNTQDFFSI